MASSGTQGQETERGARELYELKQRAAKYYSENGVPKKMEEILNSMFYANPDDVYGHLANFFETYAKKPTITKLNAREGYDSKGQPTLQTEVFCTVKNKTQLSSTLVSATPNSHLLDNAKTEDREADDLERQESVTEAIKFMNSDLNNRLSGLDPSQQKDIDDVVSKFYEEMRAAEEERLLKEEEQSVEGGSPRLAKDVETASQSSADKKSKGAKGKDPKKKGKSAASVILPMEPKEKFLPGCGAVCAASQSACIAAAHVQNIPLYEHVANLRNGENPSKLFVPLPMVTIIQGGRAAPGKQNCVKEFMVVPKPGMPLSQSLPLIQKIYAYVGKSFFNKGGMTAKLVSDIGAYSPQFDRPEQGLDLLQEAITACEMTVGQDFFLAINCAAHEIFDYDPSAMKEPQAAFPGQDMHKEKGKYELIQGQQKVPEDVVEFWAELIGRYPSVIAIIDPLKRSDKEHWMRLSDKISSSCLLIGSHAHDRPGVLKNEEINPDFRTSGIAVKFERINTVSDVLDVVKKMEEDGNQIVVSSGLGETPDNFIADFAVGVSAKFITVGAPVRGERTSQLNRLLQIENLLEMAGKLGTHKAHTFPHIAPPPLPETEEGEEEGSKKQEPTGKKK